MRKKIVIGITGPARAGKDTVGRHIERAHNFCWSSFASPLKVAAHFLIPPSERKLVSEDDKVTVLGRLGKTRREILQTLGTEYARQMIHPDIWLFHMQDAWAELKNGNSQYSGLVITDVRFENEAKFVKDEGGIIIRVLRPGLQMGDAFRKHESERGVSDALVDYDLLNDTSVDDLLREVDSIVTEVMAGRS